MRLRGIVPIVPTPFARDESIDFEALAGLIEFAAAAHACAVCLPAYASEFYKLRDAEREQVVECAVNRAAGRIPVIAQANHGSSRVAAESARRLRALGAAAINVAVPRQFAVRESDLARYFGVVLEAVDAPFVIQDFNPAGASVSAGFVGELHRRHPNFRYLKLEEPMLGQKLRAIADATGGGVEVIEGWGGMYMPELVKEGVRAVMPSLSLCDLLARIFDDLVAGRDAEALDLFEQALPQIVYSLQNMEMYHHCEKRLLRARGVLGTTVVRQLTREPDEGEAAHIDSLNARILAALDRAALPRDPR